MLLKELTYISNIIESADVFKALSSVIPPDVIESTLSQTNSVEERKRKLPSSLVVCLVIAMSIWASDSMSTVLKNLVNGLNRYWTKLGQYWKSPSSSSITEARQRLGCHVMTKLFEKIAQPLATIKTPGAFLGGLRIMAIDGTTMDIPDSEVNAKVFGYPGSRKGTVISFSKS